MMVRKVGFDTDMRGLPSAGDHCEAITVRTSFAVSLATRRGLPVAAASACATLATERIP